MDSSDSSDFEDAEEIIDDIFGKDLKFSICVKIHKLNDIISSEKDIIIKNTYDCYCYTDNNRPHDYFHIRSSQPHTNKTIIKELIKKEFNPGCNHRFFEGFYQVNEITYGMGMGS
jgi:hypothetical protein